VQRDTIERYRSYAKLDIGPALGDYPLADLSRDDITAWINDQVASEASAKTIKNKHGFLSGALKAAVHADKIDANPCERIRLPRWDRQEMVFLTHEQFQTLKAATTEYWQPMVEFLAASGCRFGEASALRPGDVDRKHHTVRIVRAWKYHSGGYELGTPKTKRSVRTIDVPASVLDRLDYSGEFLFRNQAGGPVRIHGFHRRVWRPAVIKAKLEPPPRIHDLRHTCASWMVQAGIPLPVIQRHLGHESIQTTVDIYSHLDRGSGRAASAAISAALAGPSTYRDTT
jgi:integrase